MKKVIALALALLGAAMALSACTGEAPPFITNEDANDGPSTVGAAVDC